MVLEKLENLCILVLLRFPSHFPGLRASHILWGYDPCTPLLKCARWNPCHGSHLVWLPLTSLAGICTGLSGQKRLGFYKKIWGGTKMNNGKKEPGQGSGGRVWFWFVEISPQQWDPSQGWELSQLLLLFLYQTSNFPGTGDVCAFFILAQLSWLRKLTGMKGTWWHEFWCLIV